MVANSRASREAFRFQDSERCGSTSMASINRIRERASAWYEILTCTFLPMISPMPFRPGLHRHFTSQT